MKKVLKKIIFILSVCLILVFANYILAFLSFQYGKSYFDNKDYEKAYIFLKFAVDRDLKNNNYLNYYTQTLINCKKSKKVQQELERVITLAPASEFSRTSMNELIRIRNKTLQGIGENYIENVTYGDSILHWDLGKMPIKLFFASEISNFQVPDYYFTSVQQALNTWITNLDFPFSYQVVNDPKDADLYVVFVADISEPTSNENTITVSSGLTTPIVKKNNLKRMEVKLRAINTDNQYYSPLEIYNTAMHEMGHALGIFGHSYDSFDIMYPMSYSEIRAQLSPRDINTVKLLYRLNADISNYNSDRTSENYLIDPIIILGNKNQRLEKKIIEAQRYINIAPDNSITWMTLGIAYADAQKFDDAIYSFNKALSFAKSSQQLSDINYNIAIICYEKKRYEEAISFAQKSLDTDPSSISAKEFLAYLHSKTNNTEKAISEYNELISTDPDNTDYYYNLANLYTGNANYIAAGKTINKLLAIHPEAKDDSRVKRLMIFAMFFK